MKLQQIKRIEDGVRLRVQHDDDLWTLSQIIRPGCKVGMMGNRRDQSTGTQESGRAKAADRKPMWIVLDADSTEFQPFTDVTAVGLPNCLRWLIYQGIRRDSNDTGIGQRWYSQGELDLSYEISIANNNDALLDHLDLLLTAGRLTDVNRQSIKNHLHTNTPQWGFRQHP